LRLMDSCITQLKDQEPSRTCNESKDEEEEEMREPLTDPAPGNSGRVAEGLDAAVVAVDLTFFFFITLKPRVECYKKSMSLKYEPALEPLHISNPAPGNSGRVAERH